jgi:uncharacterized DUF497 family protein
VDIEFDAAKDAANIIKHGVSLDVAIIILGEPVNISIDEKRNYGEVRVNAFGFVDGRLFVCTYTMRGKIVRVISV